MALLEPMDFFHFDEVNSTQIKAFGLLDQGQAAPFAVTADFQTQGRGRQGREWAMEKGRSFAMTLLVQIPVIKLQALSLVVGLGVRSGLEGVELQLKWPNDLMLANGDKVGGILIESRSHGETADCAIGIGINILNLQFAAYKGVKVPVQREVVAESVLAAIQKFEQSGFEAFREEYESVLWKKNERVLMKLSGDPPKEVEVLGVSPSGHLITRDSGELVLQDNGEILCTS